MQSKTEERIVYRIARKPQKMKTRRDSKLVLATKRNRFELVPRLAISWMSAAGVLLYSIRAAYKRLAEAVINSYMQLEFLE